VAKLLLLDIETAPNLAYTWGLWKQNVSLDQLEKASEMICWGAKWLGEKEVLFKSVYHHNKKQMLQTLHKLLDDADIVIHYNGRTFDIPIINKEFITNKMSPPSPYRQIDLIETAKRTFRFESNKLDFLCRQLGIGNKEKHEGFMLWKKCMAGNSKAWAEMRKYNMKDVLLTEKLYNKLKPWIAVHPNMGLYDGVDGCPKCGSKDYMKRGPGYTKLTKYQRYRCNVCLSYFIGDRVANSKKVKFRL
jgi:rRNA maturation protein Nop10